MALTKISTAMISQSAAAVDLNVDAGTFYVDTTNNRVGVGGKTDPDTPLHVVGTATATLFAGSGASLTSIPNSALANSSITINSTAVSLGGSLTLTYSMTLRKVLQIFIIPMQEQTHVLQPQTQMIFPKVLQIYTILMLE